jgi:hypothetical protein
MRFIHMAKKVTDEHDIPMPLLYRFLCIISAIPELCECCSAPLIVFYRPLNQLSSACGERAASYLREPGCLPVAEVQPV